MNIKTTIGLAIVLLVTGAYAQQDAPAAAEQCSWLSAPCPGNPIAYGSALDADKQIRESAELAKKDAAPGNPQWRAKGDQHRTYKFPDTGTDMPYRVYVPTSWDGHSELPLVVMLHGAGADENTYLDMNGKQLLHLAEQHGYVLVSPLGYNRFGAYGTPLRLPAVFGQPEDLFAKQRAAVTPQEERTLELSEKDVINVLEIVLNEYPIDHKEVFLMGHSMGSGGTWYLGAKYSQLWRAIAPMSGPFVDESNYPWYRIKQMPILMCEGTLALPSVKGSYQMRDWMINHNFNMGYLQVDANHGGMVPLVLPAVFDFFDEVRQGVWEKFAGKAGGPPMPRRGNTPIHPQ